MGKTLTRRPLATLLIALGAILALVAPLQPATSVAVPADPIAAAAQVEPAVVRIDTEIDYQNAIGVGTGIGGTSRLRHLIGPPTRRRRAAAARRGWAAGSADR